VSDRFVVHAIRGYRPDRWTYAIDELAITVAGFSADAVLEELVQAVEEALDLDEPPTPAAARCLALLAEARKDDRLSEVLADAMVLVEQPVTEGRSD
jgi:hypothetical protein